MTKTRQARDKGLLYPLDMVYDRSGVEMPKVKVVPPDRIPAPYRSLLVHKLDIDCHPGAPLRRSRDPPPALDLHTGTVVLSPRAARSGVLGTPGGNGRYPDAT